jgi:hypothetical protein
MTVWMGSMDIIFHLIPLSLPTEIHESVDGDLDIIYQLIPLSFPSEIHEGVDGGSGYHISVNTPLPPLRDT